MPHGRFLQDSFATMPEKVTVVCADGKVPCRAVPCRVCFAVAPEDCGARFVSFDSAVHYAHMIKNGASDVHDFLSWVCRDDGRCGIIWQACRDRWAAVRCFFSLARATRLPLPTSFLSARREPTSDTAADPCLDRGLSLAPRACPS